MKTRETGLLNPALFSVFLLAGCAVVPMSGFGRASGYRGGFFVTPRGQLLSAAKLPGVREHGEHYAL